MSIGITLIVIISSLFSYSQVFQSLETWRFHALRRSNNVIAHRGVPDEGVDFIQKPFSVKEPALKIRNVLDK